MSHYRLIPLKSAGWHRLGLLAAVGFAPITVMLWAMDAFGGGEIGVQSALIFYACALILVALLSFGLPWAFKGFVVRTHPEGEEDGRERSHRPAGVARAQSATASVHSAAHKKTAANHG